jgi:thermitase
LNPVLRQGKRLWFALLFALILVLSSCNSAPQPDLEPRELQQLTTIAIPETAKQSDIEKMYGGTAIVFHPEAGFAILGFDGQPELSSLALTPDDKAKWPEANGTRVWATGTRAWGTGWSVWGTAWNVWDSGTRAWATGNSTVPELPSENRANFHTVRLPQGQALARNFGQGVKVAVIDTGLDLAHPMFQGRLAPSTEWKDFVDGDTVPQEVVGTAYGHGTGVAGLILQVAPKATILPIRVLNENGETRISDLISAIDWAVQKGAHVINLSIGTDKDSIPLKQEVFYAESLGIHVIAAAGNDALGTVQYPAAYMSVEDGDGLMMSVGSMTSNQTLSSFSNFGSNLEFVAPGELLFSAYPNNQIAQFTGTSFSTPIISGIIALARSDIGTGSVYNIDDYLLSTAVSLGVSKGKYVDVTNLLRKMPSFVARKALFVADTTKLSSVDSSYKTRLEGLGYTVTVKAQATVSSADATGQDVVVISSSVTDTLLRTMFRTTPIPVVTWEELIFDDMGLTSTTQNTNFGSTTGQTQVTLAGTHPLAAGLTSSQAVYTSSNEVAWGQPSSNAAIAATVVGSTTRAAIFGYTKDAVMPGLAAPARRVGFFANNTGSLPSVTGWRLFEAAITWAVTGN